MLDIETIKRLYPKWWFEGFGNLSSDEQLERIYKDMIWGDEQIQCDLFFMVLDKIHLTDRKPTMIELGSAGIEASLYSLIFEKKFNEYCEIINTEPRKEHIDAVKKYWQHTGIHLKNAKIYHCYTGEGYDLEDKNLPQISLLQLFNENNIEKLDILHVDIQGDELSVCKELIEENLFKKTRFMFINTHHQVQNYSLGTFTECLNYLEKNNNVKIYFADPFNGGFGDGLIVLENLDF
jgi:hypothetical protein